MRDKKSCSASHAYLARSRFVRCAGLGLNFSELLWRFVR